MTSRIAATQDADFIVKAYATSFGFTVQQTEAYVGKMGLENFYIADHEDRPAAVFALIATGHWFGGRAVPACNIAHVAILPEYRGLGLADAILEDAGAIAASRGALLTTLFASTRPVYRRGGYEMAGSEIVYEAETSELYKIKEKYHCRQLTLPAALPNLASIHERQCEVEAGNLQRSAAQWSLLLTWPDPATSIYVFDSDEDVAYVIIDTSNPECMIIRDWAALSGRAARCILRFLGTFSTVYPRVRWHGSAQDKLVFAMPDKGWRLVHQEEFLMRVLSARDALLARGYNSVTEKVTLEIMKGDQVETLSLSIENGTPYCRTHEAGLPIVKIASEHLATLYSGFRSASFLARAGWINGDRDGVMACDRIFSGPPPWVGEHF
ncbi:GNAT family N-acetyltransferase [Rhizobium laguerreae]|uniref:GNAT family N-acetyltransferase n=1 Tax=Rhizobium laguerreae TaxID=1076926 RepID=UPI001C929700|nr:GNAT family N-acetyltransferase [Rhizobium laguerreae]MBY3265144.1 GNAT family N-acetyltransferase [Rhizobium laguerreae]MBY3339858.1 GNAT family N-acetyltransferase [Rhizobium laguerreae]